MKTEVTDDKILDAATRRAVHFSKALSWYAKELECNSSFQQSFLKLVEDLSLCSRQSSNPIQVFFLAVGKSAQVANLLASMFISVGILARFLHPTEAFHGDLGVIGKQDIVVLISNNGKSSELIQLFPGLKERDVKTFAMTSQVNSPLATQSDNTLLISPFEEMCPLKQAPITSTISTLALGQLLVAATVEKRTFTLEQYAKNHPGGAIGKRIFLKVNDLMHKGEKLPVVEPDAPFLDVVSKMTKFAKAALLVVNGNQFVGLITEKDLRTHMEKWKAEVFNHTAKDFMNINCKKINAEILAIEAKNLMLSNAPPLNVFPVVSEEGLALGLIHINDLILADV